MCEKVFDSIGISDSSCTIKQPEIAFDYNWLIEKQIVEYLQSKVEQVYVMTSSEKTMTLSYKPVSQHIEYQKIKKKTFERHIDSQIYFRLVDANNVVLKDSIFTKAFVDTVTAGDLDRVENSAYSFTNGTRKQTLLGLVYEPLIVTAVTGLIIYLFYSYRSQ
jgi:hypothetical protein